MTSTYTYTITDIRKVFECFHADLRMLAHRTMAMQMSIVDKTSHDVHVFAEYECLGAVHIQLRNGTGNILKVHEYKQNENVAGNTARPGGNSWPCVPTGSLNVILNYSDGDKASQAKNSGRLLLSWTPTSSSTDYSNMTRTDHRNYNSHGYGLSRNSYSKD